MAVDAPSGAPELAPPLPPELQVEVTSACNLRCAMCLVSYRPPVNKVSGAMPPEMFAGLVDSLPDLRRLTLQGLGEPLLSPYLIDMVRRARRAGSSSGFNSNATLLSPAGRANWSPPGWLAARVPGRRERGDVRGDPRRRGFRPGGGNLAGLVAAKRAAGSATRGCAWSSSRCAATSPSCPTWYDYSRSRGGRAAGAEPLPHLRRHRPGRRYAGIRWFTAREALWARRAGRGPVRRAFRRGPRGRGRHGLLLRLPGRPAPPSARADSGRLHVALGRGVRHQRRRGAAVLHGDGRRPDGARPARRAVVRRRSGTASPTGIPSPTRRRRAAGRLPRLRALPTARSDRRTLAWPADPRP